MIQASAPHPDGERGSSQRGQAIVLIAIMLAVVVGMAALAIDGSRAYAVRRDLQAAVDAAALAAADKLQQTGGYAAAEQAASTMFGINLRLYAPPSCAPGYAGPGASPVTVTCTYSDGTVLTQVVSALGPQGSQFAMTATRSLDLQFGRILTNGATPRLVANASSGVNNLAFSPTLAALNQAGCGGAPGTAISINGSGTLRVVGDVVSNGLISAVRPAQVAGDVYARCQSSISGVATTCHPSGAATPCGYPDVAGAVRTGFRFSDPNYPPPAVPGAGRGQPAANVVLLPGSYASNASIAPGRCYFLSGGVYRWQAGYTSNGGFVSNELKPPDEPVFNNNTQLSNRQFWNTNGVNCAGAFRVTLSGSSGLDLGTWGIEVTSVRKDSYAGNSYSRESAPSRCQPFTVKNIQTITLDVSNVPGATSYNVYLSNNGCSAPFGLVWSMPVSVAVQNTDTSGCPFGTGSADSNGNFNNNNCSLGGQSLSVPALVLPFLPLANLFAPPGTFSAYPPDGETAPLQAGLPNQNPNRATPPAGDRANEDACATIGGAPAVCPGITPGAVAFFIPSGGCLNTTNTSDNFVFSGYQYNWLVIFEPGASAPPANTCSNVMGAAGNSAFIGLVYLPSASLTVPSGSGFLNDLTGGIIADTIAFTGSLPRIVGNLLYMPVPPAARLTG